MKKAKHLAEEYGEKAVNKVKSVRDEGKNAAKKIFQCGLSQSSHVLTLLSHRKRKRAVSEMWRRAIKNYGDDPSHQTLYFLSLHLATQDAL